MTEETLEKAVAEIWKLFKETDTRFKETDARLDRRFQETDARMERRSRETERKFQETREEIRKATRLFTSQWGRLIEALVKPDAVRLFQKRGIRISRVSQRSKSQYNGKSMEIDLLLDNDDAVVVVEVKSTLRVRDVQRFAKKLDEFLTFFPRYRGCRVYGGVAGMDIVEEADKYAYRRGLFVLGMAGEGVVRIMNDKEFEPKDFAA